MSTPFGSYTVRLDPWQIEYGGEMEALGASAPAGADDAAVRTDVELAHADWRALAPPAELRPLREVLFVDGVRRLEARLVVRGDERYFHGAFGSHAVGAVVATEGAAAFGELRIGRAVVLGSGQSLAEPVRLLSALEYQPLSTESNEPDAPLVCLHRQMRVAEEGLARELADQDGVLVIADGPLSFEDKTRGAAVGFVKRVMQTYLPEDLLALLPALPAGHRTPLFAIEGPRRFERYSWYLRLAAPRPGDSVFSGIVRLEVAAAVGRERAAELADDCTARVPAFAGTRGLHARAPQNLLPIGALETRLRRELGDARGIHRIIQSFIAQEAIHGQAPIG